MTDDLMHRCQVQEKEIAELRRRIKILTFYESNADDLIHFIDRASARGQFMVGQFLAIEQEATQELERIEKHGGHEGFVRRIMEIIERKQDEMGCP